MTTAWSWGRLPRVRQRVHALRWAHEGLPLDTAGAFLPYGCGRSYGDSCVNDGEAVLATRALDRFVHFDREAGLLQCEAGVTLGEVLALTVPAGWFLPVTPGTQFVTAGGAVANDVHGKNHERQGTFGHHVTRIELERSDRGVEWISPENEPALFAATVGGLGLTGLIRKVEIRLRKVSGPWFDVEHTPFASLDEFFELSTAAHEDWEYSVAWLDCTASGGRFGRGIFSRANHSSAADFQEVRSQPSLALPVDFPGWALNRFTVRAFNELYFARGRRQQGLQRSHYLPYLYPLDSIGRWNRIYGPQGFFQHQCVLPPGHQQALGEMLAAIVDSGQASFLSVLKEFGDKPSVGLLSFPRPGTTLALDFPNRGQSTLRLLERLDAIVLEAGGALYPAKDARMSPEMFRAGFPEWEGFSAWVDPRFSSSFWRRVAS